MLFATAVRVLAMAARGHYIATDEGYYLLLGQNLWHGRGYTLNGLPHITFSPLYPVLTGAFAFVTGPVWAGRVVTVLAGCLLLIPVWVVARRLGGWTTARAATLLLAVLPALVAFVPGFSGRELYEGGSEPLFYLVVFGALALTPTTLGRAAVAGLLLGLAYLARPEALVAAAVVGLWAAWPARGVGEGWGRAMGRGLARGSVYTVLLAVCMVPWVLRMHTLTGQWSLSGRSTPVVTSLLRGTSPESPSAAAAAVDVAKDLLWGGSEYQYIKDNYSIARSGDRLTSEYWGIYPRTGPPHAPHAAWTPLPPPPMVTGKTEPSALAHASRLVLYWQTLGLIFPWWLWPFALAGIFGVRRRGRQARDPRALGTEFALLGATVGTSLLVAVLVYVDPRNHVLLVPMLAIYAGAGALSLGRMFARVIRSPRPRPIVTGVVVAGPVLAALVLGGQIVSGLTTATAMSVTADVNAESGTALGRLLPPGLAVMSWHPGVAVYAGRDWRVLPYEPLPVVLAYPPARAAAIVLSPMYPEPFDASYQPALDSAAIVAVLPGGSRSGPVAVSDFTRVAHEGMVTIARLRPATP
jgi:hypothetical protein